MYICHCQGITDSEIKAAIASGSANTMKDLRKTIGVAAQCGKCSRFTRQLLNQSLAAKLAINAA